MSVFKFENGEYSLNADKFGDEGPAAEIVDHPFNIFDLVDTDKQDRNSHIKPGVQTRCFICNKPLGQNQYAVHMDIFGGLYSKAEEAGLNAAGESVYDDEHSQGGWDLGSECAKKVPAAYKTKINIEEN